MVKPLFSLFLINALLLAMLSLSGCATTGTPEQRISEKISLLEAENKYREAGYYYFKLAQDALAPQKQDYQLRAIEQLIRGEYITQAQTTLLDVDVSQIDRTYFIRKQLLAAEVALAVRKPGQALTELRTLENDDLSPEQTRQHHLLLAKTYTMGGDLLQATGELITLDAYLDEDAARKKNQQRIMGNLIKLSEDILLNYPDSNNDSIDNILNKEQQKKIGLQTTQLASLVSAWRQYKPEHISQDMLQMIEDSLSQLQHPTTLTLPKNIALLLPLSGHYAPAGEAVRDGIIASNYTYGNDVENPTLRFYDTGGEPKAAWMAYKQALKDGAEFVIGPLNKDAVTYIAQARKMPIPTLALNNAIETEKPPLHFYQFGLAPEDEAIQLADRAWNDEHKRAVILIPENTWGDRIGAAFIDHWNELGGEIAAISTYDSRKSDFASPIREAFNLKLSDQRHRNLQNLLSQKLSFTPRRRQDIDLIMIAAFPRQARLIRPQLRFHYASNIPVYTTSHAFSGKINPMLDRDMDGIIFADMPWTLSTENTNKNLQEIIIKAWPKADRQYWRLYALGADAYAISAYLNNPSTRLFSHRGNTGNIYMDHNQRIYRELIWAQFRRGIPRIIN
jgi:hypothetical protein